LPSPAFNHTASCAVKRAGIVDVIGPDHPIIPAIIGTAAAILCAMSLFNEVASVLVRFDHVA
jgi:hypothetical protein